MKWVWLLPGGDRPPWVPLIFVSSTDTHAEVAALLLPSTGLDPWLVLQLWGAGQGLLQGWWEQHRYLVPDNS